MTREAAKKYIKKHGWKLEARYCRPQLISDPILVNWKAQKGDTIIMGSLNAIARYVKFVYNR